MTSPLTPQQIESRPERICSTHVLSTGERVTLRALSAADADLFGDYLAGLSAATRAMFAPHAFTREAAAELCRSVDLRHTIRLLVVPDRGGKARAVAYFLLQLGVGKAEREHYEQYDMPLSDEQDCMFAPCVADDWQNRGLGSALTPAVLDVARRLGRRWVILMGGVKASNRRAIHFYEKFGFRTVGHFGTEETSWDMILSLAAGGR